MSRRTYDVIVIGLGAMGSATLYHLARRGCRVLGIEQFSQGHQAGSSHGDSRIIREQYFEHPQYVPLVQRAYQLWRELEGESGRPLMTITGGLMIGPADGMVVAGTIRSATEHQLPHEVLGPRDVHARFPAFDLRDDLVAVLDPRAGYLQADACNAAHIELARRAGADAHFDEQVVSWEPGGNGFRVNTHQGAYFATRLLLAGGAWNAELAGDVGVPLQIERQVLFWFDVGAAAASFDPSRCPIFICEYAAGSFYYGFPGLARGVKASVMHHGEIAATAVGVRRTVGNREVEPLRAALRSALPALSVARVRESGVCPFTNTPDGDFVIDWHRRFSGQVLVSSPCSGHGFKFASAIGELQADLLTTGQTQFDLTPFRLDRFSS